MPSTYKIYPSLLPSPMTQRIEKLFTRTRAENRAALVAYVMAGDPDDTTSAALLAALPGAGVDIIELGMPFSDPMAEGPVIQSAAKRALGQGASLSRTLKLAHDFRRQYPDMPLVLMGYANPVLAYEPARFMRDAARAGVDGLILVDLPPEEDGSWRKLAQDEGLVIIRLATPTTDDKRLPTVLAGAGGFLYFVSITGVTGTRSAIHAEVQQSLERIRRHTDLPLAVGFGIRNPEHVAAYAADADAVIVGSAIIERLAANLDAAGRPKPDLIEDVTDFVRTLSAATLRSGPIR